jgi:hypothetical protein
MSVNPSVLARPPVVGISAVLPESGLLKSLAVLFDRVVCDDLSVHIVEGHSEGMRSRSKAEWNIAYNARARELIWLRDAGLLSPLADFAQEIGLSKDALDEIRKTNQANAAELAHGNFQEAAATFISAYQTLLASSLQSYSVTAISVSPNKEFNRSPHPASSENDSEVVEVVVDAMPGADVLANWDSILELRRDPALIQMRLELWKLIQNASTRDAMIQKRTNGERVANIQFGYRLCVDGKHLEPDPGEQAVLNEIRRLRQSGATLRGIAAALNHRGHRTRRGSAWRLEHVARITRQAVSISASH